MKERPLVSVIFTECKAADHETAISPENEPDDSVALGRRVWYWRTDTPTLDGVVHESRGFVEFGETEARGLEVFLTFDLKEHGRWNHTMIQRIWEDSGK